MLPCVNRPHTFLSSHTHFRVHYLFSTCLTHPQVVLPVCAINYGLPPTKYRVAYDTPFRYSISPHFPSSKSAFLPQPHSSYRGQSIATPAYLSAPILAIQAPSLASISSGSTRNLTRACADTTRASRLQAQVSKLKNAVGVATNTRSSSTYGCYKLPAQEHMYSMG